jgi:hypothetical protein
MGSIARFKHVAKYKTRLDNGFHSVQDNSKRRIFFELIYISY